MDKCAHGLPFETDCEQCLFEQEVVDDQATDDDWPADEVEVDLFGNAWPAGETLAEYLERVKADEPISDSTLQRIGQRISKYLSR